MAANNCHENEKRDIINLIQILKNSVVQYLHSEYANLFNFFLVKSPEGQNQENRLRN